MVTWATDSVPAFSDPDGTRLKYRMQWGESGSPVSAPTANIKWLEYRARSTATSGDNRLAYLRFDLDGAGASGECLRAFTDLGAALATARGAHISLQASNTGYITGLGAGLDAQLFLADAALPAGGTYCVVNTEIYSNGTTSTPAAVTTLAFQRFVNGGDATGATAVDAKAFLFDLSGFSSGAASLWYDHQGSAPANIEEWLKVKTPAGTRWLPLYNAVV
jgi:hypothetical protein